MIKRSLSKSIFGGIIVIVGILFISGRIEPQTISDSDSFASEPVQISGFDLEIADENKIPRMIIIPSLNVFLDVRVSEIKGGYWEVFEEVAGWGVGSGVPGEGGNQVIFAHARDGLFASLKDAEEGMRILVLTNDSWYEYEVAIIDEVYPRNTRYIEQTENEILTLYTCSGFNDTKRLIVIAEPISRLEVQPLIEVEPL